MTERTYKDLFDRINMGPEKNSEIRSIIENEGKSVKKRKWSAARWAVAAAFAIAALMCVQPTRNAVIAAADKVIGLFSFKDGSTVEIKQDENSSKVTFTEPEGEEKYYEVVEGRLIFTADDIRRDITDEVSDTEYFRYESALADGGKSVIFVGGSSEKMYGWVELIFDADGRYVTNRMNVPVLDEESYRSECEEWSYKCMHEEGVHTGNPKYDD